MIYWTFKSFFNQPSSLIGSALGIALALILGLFLDAVFRGEASQILTFIERSPGEVWVLEKGVADLHMARWVPDVAVQFSLPAALRLGAATLLIAELAAFIPAMYVQKVDPAPFAAKAQELLP